MRQRECSGEMDRRRLFALLAGTAMATATSAKAQQPQKIRVVGFLHPGFAESGSPGLDALRDGLREAGYGNGDNIRIETRWAAGRPEVLRQLAEDLVKHRVDLVVATARPSIEAARAAAPNLPIVADDLESDPIASGYVASLARPGGNITGLFLDAPSLCSKWLQQMRELMPNLTKIAVLWDTTTGSYQLDAIKAAAKSASIDLVVMEFRNDSEIEASLDSGLKQNPQAVIQLGSPLIRQAGPRIAQVLSAHRMPGISEFRTFADAGGLMSYGPDLIHLFRRIGFQVAEILRGTKAADLPIERPTKFELVINLKTAKALGIVVPSALLARADEVIE